MKLLYLTTVVPFANEKGQARIDKALKKSKEDDDEPGYLSKKWYTSQNLRPPPDLEDDEDTDEITEDGYMFLDGSELDYEFFDILIPLDEFAGCEENSLIGSQLYTKSGEVFHIEETPEQLLYYIKFLNRNWAEKTIDRIQIEINKLINKFKHVN